MLHMFSKMLQKCDYDKMVVSKFDYQDDHINFLIFKQ